MKSKFILGLLCSFLMSSYFAQSDYIVFLKDKDAFNAEKARSSLSVKSLKNRNDKNILLDQRDQSLKVEYIQTLNHFGKVLKKSKW